MKKIQLTHQLPWEAHDIFRLIMQTEHYKDIYPMVSGVKVLAEGQDSKDLELTFRLGKHIPLKDPVERTRVTWVKDREIHTRSVSGPFKHLNLDWKLEPLPKGGTKVTFDMAYDTGKGFLANSLLEPFVNKAVHDTLTRFEAYARKALEPLTGQKPQKTAKGRRPGDPRP